MKIPYLKVAMERRGDRGLREGLLGRGLCEVEAAAL